MLPTLAVPLTNTCEQAHSAPPSASVPDGFVVVVRIVSVSATSVSASAV
jgi:hypothetical protein